MTLIENFRYRSEQLCRIRRFFGEHHFVEVQTPVLSADTIVDLHVEPIRKISNKTTNFYPLTV